MQRDSIHNIHADKDYIAYKMNPVGVTPMMFASAAFILPQSVFGLLNKMFPESGTIEWIYLRMNLTSVLGVWVYIAIIVILTIAFSFIMLTPGKTAEDLL